MGIGAGRFDSKPVPNNFAGCGLNHPDKPIKEDIRIAILNHDAVLKGIFQGLMLSDYASATLF